MKTYFLPHYLQPYKTLIDQTTKESVKLRFKDTAPELTESKIGGTPYTENYSSLAKDNEGHPMQLLVQLNCKELHLPYPFPQDGLIQIFVNQQFGNIHTSKTADQFHVKFIATIEQIEDEDSLLGHHFNPSKYFPIQKTYALQGEMMLDPVSSLDYRYNDYFTFEKLCLITEDERTFEEIYFETYLGAEHKVGGYPYFIENDFRVGKAQLQQYDTLLLQLVSDDEHYINYRDSGIVSFFINSEKLKDLDFTDIYMHIEDY
jgi:uncharacterized protein YwqG